MCQRDPNKWMECLIDKYQWRGTSLGLGRSRGRDLGENQDSCRKISVDCGNYELWVDSERPSFLWITSLCSRVTCCWDLEQKFYGWVEFLSQAAICTYNLKDKWFIYFLSCIYELNCCAWTMCIWEEFICCYVGLLDAFHVYFSML
jgi:hypothetical protein